MKIVETEDFIKLAKKKKKNNPFAICHSVINKKKNPEKWEDCVLDIKKKQKAASVKTAEETPSVFREKELDQEQLQCPSCGIDLRMTSGGENYYKDLENHNLKCVRTITAKKK